MHHKYSSSVSPFQAKTGTPVAAMLENRERPSGVTEKTQSIRGGSMILSGEDVLKQRV